MIRRRKPDAYDWVVVVFWSCCAVLYGFFMLILGDVVGWWAP